MSAEPVPASDDRYMAVLTTLSRHGVRLPPERMSRLVADVLAAVGTSVPDWRPDPDYADRKGVREKNPAPGRRVCSHCKRSLSLTRFGTNVVKGKRRPKTACRECLNNAQRNRYITARKMEGALNKARLEFVADDDVIGLRCLDCHAEIVAGDEVVAETGLRHLACRGEA